LQRELDSITNAKTAWEKLKEKTRAKGIMGKLEQMQIAIRSQFNDDVPFSTTINEIRDAIADIHEPTAPTMDEWTTVLLLNALNTPNYDWLRKNLISFLTNSKLTLSVEDIIQRIEVEAHENRQSYVDENLMAAQLKRAPNKQRPRCTLCKRSGHIREKCWEKGGGAENNAPEWWRKGQESWKKKKEKAYIADSDESASESAAIFIEPAKDKYHTDAHDNVVEIVSATWEEKTVNGEKPFNLDTAATSHCSPVIADFIDFTPIEPKPVKGVNGACIMATGKGTIKLRLGKGRKIKLLNALYVPEATLRLISIGKICDDGHEATFSKTNCRIYRDDGKTIAEGTRKSKGLYTLSGSAIPMPGETAYIARAIPDLKTWHLRLGHVHYDAIKTMAEKGMVEGMKIDLSLRPPECKYCNLGKQTKKPMPKRRGGSGASKPLEIVNSDITGPEDVPSAGGAKYILNFVDDYTSMTWAYLLKTKDQAASKFKEWRAIVESESGHRIKILRTDNGGEYTSTNFEKYLCETGMKHQLTAPYSSFENGKSERQHRTLMDRARSILAQTGLRTSMWGECILTSCYIKNRTPTNALKGKTPYEMWHNKKPDLSHMREIGCQAFVLKNDLSKTPKIYSRSIECVLIGYADNSKAYRCYDPIARKIHISRNVRFIESLDQESHPLRPGVVINIPRHADINEAPQRNTELPEATREDTEMPENIQDDQVGEGTEEEVLNVPVEVEAEVEIDPGPRRSQRSRHLSAAGAAMKGINITTRTQKAVQQAKEATLRTKEKKNNTIIPEDDQRENTINEEEDDEQGYVALLDDEEEEEEECYGSTEEGASSWREAAASDEAEQWQAAYREEMESLKKHNVWTLIPRHQVPKGRKIIKSKPCFVRKKDENGKVVRHKVRVVAKGFTQVAGIDFNETFASVARMESMRTLLHIGAIQDWEIHQMDVKTAFLHGELEEELYMEQPEGMKEPGKENWVAVLNKSLYGLRQAGRRWAKKLQKSMIEEGFTQISVEHSLYIRKTETGTSMVAVHVDDMAVAASSKEEITRLAKDLNKHFEIVDLGPIKWLLGIAIERDRTARTIALSQVAYIDGIIDKFQQKDGYEVSTPLDHNVVLSKDLCPKEEIEKERMKKIPYREAIGSLMYAATATRPDIAFATHKLSQYLENPGQGHWTAALRVIRYLKKTKEYRLTLGGKHELSLSGYSDSDWAADTDDRRSTSGYAFSLGTGSISWRAKKHSAVASSSTEAEYIAADYAAKEASWLRSLLNEIGFSQEKPTNILCDNTGALALTKDASYHARTKHIDVKHHFIRERVENKEVKFEYIPTNEMVADILTKALPKPKHEKFTRLLGLWKQ
ncbi:MAG TPA: reverse transcriptase domain-containing protein, partial [Chlamydiales bacterium]|nr:reverse transcriptase domain-containing protein [Chlamydiales bacterium]